MSRREKIIARFLARPKDFSYNELAALLKIYGYEEVAAGKTSGSRRAFFRKTTGHLIRLHKPHPENSMKIYQIDLVIEELRKQNLL